MTITHAYDELLDLLSSGATTEWIANFRSSPETQARVCELIERKKDGSITSDEIAEMEEYLNLEHVMIMAKSHARERLES